MESRPMESITSFLNNVGTWYIRIPPEYAQHLNLKEGDQGRNGRIRSETNKKGQTYCSIWKDGN